MIETVNSTNYWHLDTFVECAAEPSVFIMFLFARIYFRLDRIKMSKEINFA